MEDRYDGCFLGIVACILVLVIDIYFAASASQSASAKGHNGTKWGIISFFFGIIGYILVAALPDLQLRHDINMLTRAILNSSSTTSDSATSSAHTSAPQPFVVPATTSSAGPWNCKACGEKNAAGTLFCKNCGEYR